MGGRNEHLGEGQRGKLNLTQLFKYNRSVYYGRVMDISTDGTKRIKVRIKGIDDDLPTNNDLPWCHSFLPYHFNLVPQVGETVKVLLMDADNPNAEREWIGPLISEPVKIARDPHFYTSRAGREGGLVALGKSIDTLETKKQLFPQPDDVSLLGRNNSEVTCRKEEVLIRVAKHMIDAPTEINKKNPAFINVRLLKPSDLNKKEATSTKEKELGLSEERVDTVILSNKIFLIGRDSKSKVIELGDVNGLTKEQHLTLEEKLHPLVYGDILLEFMELFQTWMLTHIHEGDRLGTDFSGDTLKMLDWFKNRLPLLISKNVYAGGDVPTTESSNIKSQ
jgi:hypothetical protein